MTCKELVDYLSGFDPNEKICSLILDLENKKVYQIKERELTDTEKPGLLFELGKSYPMDEFIEAINDQL